MYSTWRPPHMTSLGDVMNSEKRIALFKGMCSIWPPHYWGWLRQRISVFQQTDCLSARTCRRRECRLFKHLFQIAAAVYPFKLHDTAWFSASHVWEKKGALQSNCLQIRAACLMPVSAGRASRESDSKTKTPVFQQGKNIIFAFREHIQKTRQAFIWVNLFFCTLKNQVLPCCQWAAQ